MLFADDDVRLDPGWLDAALDHFSAQPDDVAVTGQTLSDPYDPLHAVSIEITGPGQYFTCNMGYRCEVFERLGGFSHDYWPLMGEDVDLAFRALLLGHIGHAPAMLGVHTPRAQTFRQLARRGRFAVNDVKLFRRWAHHYGRAQHLPALVFPYANIAVVWGGILRAEGLAILRRPGRLLRLVGIAAGQTLWATRALLRSR